MYTPYPTEGSKLISNFQKGGRGGGRGLTGSQFLQGAAGKDGSEFFQGGGGRGQERDVQFLH